MKKKSVWVAEDGTEFESQDEALLYERDVMFDGLLIVFFSKYMNLPEDRTISLLHEIRPLLNMIRDNADEFQEVLDAAKPKARRGRPPTKSPAVTEEQVKENFLKVQEIFSVIPGFEIEDEERDTELVSRVPGEWRAGIPKRAK